MESPKLTGGLKHTHTPKEYDVFLYYMVGVIDYISM